MGRKTQVIKTFDPKKDERGSFANRFMSAQGFFTKHDIPLKFRLKNDQKVLDEIIELGKKAEFVAIMDGPVLSMRLAYGSKKHELARLDLGAETDVKKRRANA